LDGDHLDWPTGRRRDFKVSADRLVPRVLNGKSKLARSEVSEVLEEEQAGDPKLVEEVVERELELSEEPGEVFVPIDSLGCGGKRPGLRSP